MRAKEHVLRSVVYVGLGGGSEERKEDSQRERCTDKKRETIYIKDEDKWEKEDEDKKKLQTSIRESLAKQSVDFLVPLVVARVWVARFLVVLPLVVVMLPVLVYGFALEPWVRCSLQLSLRFRV